MGLQELYTEIEGNYKDIMERLVTETRVRKFVLLFLEDVVLVYKCGQKKLNNLYYQMKE